MLFYSKLHFVCILYRILQGYITILADTESFLRLKHDVQQISEQRIRDLVFLFLCEMEFDIKAFLSVEELNCRF